MGLDEVRRRLRGSIAPLITPFTDDGSLDLQTLADLVDWHIAEGTHGLSVTGTTGEPSALSLDEREQVMTFAAQAIGGRVPFVPGTGSTNLQETLRLTRRAVDLGADAALLIVPYYSRPSQAGLYRFFHHIAASVDLPLILYNIPGRTAVNLEPETLARLAEDCPNVIGVKESNSNFLQVSRVLALCGRDFLLYSGIETLCYPMLTLGGAGHVSATANLLPREVADLYNLAAAGRWEAARDLHYRLLALNEALFWETNPGPLKAAMGLAGRARPVVRLPLGLPDAAMQSRLGQVLAQYGLSVVDGPPVGPQAKAGGGGEKGLVPDEAGTLPGRWPGS